MNEIISEIINIGRLRVSSEITSFMIHYNMYNYLIKKSINYISISNNVGKCIFRFSCYDFQLSSHILYYDNYYDISLSPSINSIELSNGDLSTNINKNDDIFNALNIDELIIPQYNLYLMLKNENYLQCSFNENKLSIIKDILNNDQYWL